MVIMAKWKCEYYTNPMDNGEFPYGTEHVEYRFDTEEEMYSHLREEANKGSVWNCTIYDPVGYKRLEAHYDLIAD